MEIKEENEKLLKDVKNYLDITYQDEEIDEKVSGIIERGKQYLNSAAGAELDFITEDIARQLLFDVCRYIRSNAFEHFEENFKSQLVALRLKKDMEAYAAKRAADI